MPKTPPSPAVRERWRGSVYPKGGTLYLHVKVDGRWRGVATTFRVGQETEAEQHLAEVRARLWAEEDARARAPGASAGPDGPLTVRRWSKTWLKTRGSAEYDDQRHLRLHVWPVIGDMRLSDVRPRHLRELVVRLEAKKAPRTVRNVYSTCRSLFRDAVLEDLLATSPCILGGPHLPEIVDKDSEWRSGAVFTRDELRTLISPHPAIEADSTVTYALLGLAALRHGEMAGLRWRHYDAGGEPLGKLIVATSYRKGRTKTKVTRWMPVHPVLAAILAEWKLEGWPRLMGRRPTDEDLVLPLPTTSRRRVEMMRRKDFTWKRADRHLEDLGWRHRRVHDLRRTFISLARADGADRDILKRGTHAPPKDVIELYTSVEWSQLCAEVAKLQVSRRPAGGALATVLPEASGAVGSSGALGKRFGPKRAKRLRPERKD